jgi:hypothetical protein
MTYAEYNTDENFNKPSNAMELVRLGKEEGKTREEIANSLSPLWKEDKKGNVKKALDYHFAEKPKEEPKAEEKPVEEKVTEKVIEQTAPKAKTSTLDEKEKNYIKKQDELADTALNTTLNDVENRRTYNWEQQYETDKKAGEAFKRIDDKMIEQLPTFLFRRYQNGEFGDISDTSTPEGRESKKNAQLRLAHFIINEVQAKLKNASNAFMSAAGRSPIFADTTSDYEKYQQSNLAKGLENRWRKYEAETENAIQLAAKESMTEQEARLEAEKIANDKKMATKWNMMDARQKVDLMNIKREIGKLVGDMDLSEIADFMTGGAISGDLSVDEAVAIGVAQLVKKSPELLRKLPEGKYKSAVLGLFGGGTVDSVIASLSGGSNDKKDEPSETSDSSSGVPKAGITMNDEEFEKLQKYADELSAKYYRGEISREDFEKEWDKAYKEMKKHPVYSKKNNIRLLSTKEILAANKELELKDKFGEDTKSKTFKNGKKAVEYFDGKTKLFEYLKSTDEPNFIDAKAATKNNDYKMKDYQEALKQYEILKKADAVNMVGKY